MRSSGPRASASPVCSQQLRREESHTSLGDETKGERQGAEPRQQGTVCEEARAPAGSGPAPGHEWGLRVTGPGRWKHRPHHTLARLHH